MPVNEEGVTPDSPTGSQESVQPDPAPSPVSDGNAGLPTDRPAENIKAEFDRKFGQLSQQMNDLMAILASGPAPQAKPAQPVEYTDEQLMELARAGSVEAQLKLQERVASRAAQSQVQAVVGIQAAQSALQRLYAQYPQLQNPQDPLTIEAMKAKHLLVRSGKAAQDPATDLEAIKEAVTYHSHLIQRGQVPTQEFNRVAQTRPQAGMDGSTTRPRPPAKTQGRKVTDPKILAVAQRMGVNAEEAMARFEERQKKGQSSVSPMVGMIIREQD